MQDKILILGEGFIGERLHGVLNCDISSRIIHALADAEEEIKKYNPDIIINCVGHTGKNNVDGCELDKDKTLAANTFAPIILAEAAIRNNKRLVHISSGCIYHFDYAKDEPISEDKEPDYFELFYSRSKIYSDEALRVLSRKHPILIARIRIPLDNRPHPKNIITKLLNYKKVIDIPNSVTYIPDFIGALMHLIKIQATGIYNIVVKGGLRYPKLLDAYKKYVPGFEYQILDFKKMNLTRTNLLLSTEKLEKTGFKVRNIREVTEECVREYVRYLSQVQPAS